MVVRVGSASSSANILNLDDEERTLSSPSASRAATMSGEIHAPHVVTPPPAVDHVSANGAATTVNPLRIELKPDQTTTPQTAPPPRRSVASTLAKLFGVLLLLTAASALAFYVGRQYERQQTAATRSEDVLPSPTVPPALPEATPQSVFQQKLREVDSAPREAIARMNAERNERPQEVSTDPQFLYLYGRAMMNAGNLPEARSMFRQALGIVKARKAPDSNSAANSEMIAAVERNLDSDEPSVLQNASKALEDLVQNEQSPSSQQTSSVAPALRNQ